MTATTGQHKVCSFTELEAAVADARHVGKRVVLCHGVFDLMHPGHVLHLKAARQHGDVLIVTVTPDRFVNKGPGRPVFPQRLRVETIAALECVDHVAVNEWPTAVETIERLRPHVYAKGSDYADASADVTGGIVAEEAAVKAVGGRLLFTDEESFSSSGLINRFFSHLSPAAETFLRDFRRRHSSQRVIDALNSVARVRVLVIGEAILDEYCYCEPLGKSPKETIIAARFESEERFAGGSLAVANHIAGFCEQVTLVTCLGADPRSQEFIRSRMRSNLRLVSLDGRARPLITKRRYLESTFLTKMFEVQCLDDRPISHDLEQELLEVLVARLPEHDLIVVADFGHGLLTERVRNELCGRRYLAVNTQTNSANLGFNPPTKYARADYLCVHEGEIRLALRVPYGDVHALARQLRDQLGALRLMVTRGPNGSLLVSADGSICETPALAVRVLDRTGAGDAFFALTAPCAYVGVPEEVLGFVGNCAGALAVETVCNREPIDPVVLKRFITHLLA